MRLEPIAPSLRKGRGRPDMWELAHKADHEEAMVAELKPSLTEAEALVESYRCLECGGPYAPAPCTVACPADVDVAGFVSAIARGEVLLAAGIIFDANPLGGTCARVCPTEVLCEGACVLETAGQRPVDIGRLQRYATDFAFSQGATFVPGRTAALGRSVAVIGAGPAGMAFAATLTPLGYRVTVYDERPEVGGLVRYAIAPYREVQDPLPQEMERLAQSGVEFRLGTPIDRPETLRAIEEESEAIFLGVGLGVDAAIHYEGDELEGVWESLPFIEGIKTGHSPSVGRRVFVIGGGNTAMDVAREAVRLGAEEVTIVYRRTREEMPAYPHEVVEAEREGVRFLWLTLPIRLVGQERLEALTCQTMRLGEPDASGRRRPVPVPDSEYTLPADTVVKAMGQRARTDFFAWIEGLRVEGGRVVADARTGQTGNPRYFVGGDAENGGDTVVEAVRLGKRAAHSVDRLLRGREAS